MYGYENLYIDKDKYTMYVTKTTPFWIIDTTTYSLVRARQSYA